MFFVGADDDALEAALGLGDLASLTITNEADPLSYDVSCLHDHSLVLGVVNAQTILKCFLGLAFILILNNVMKFQISSSKEAFRKTWNAKYTLRR